MAIHFKVLNGTTADGDSLCDTCHNSQVVEGYSVGHKVIWCNDPIDGLLIQWPVAKCNQYRARENTALKEMEKIAWVVTPRKRGKVGFVQILPPDPTKKKDDEYGDPSELNNGTQ